MRYYNTPAFSVRKPLFGQGLCSALAITWLSLSLAGCASTDGASRFSPGAIAGAQTTDISNAQGYVNAFPEMDINTVALSNARDVFKIGDTADISVYDVDSLTNSYIVDRSGNVSFPLIGTVKVAGLNTTELQQILTQRYGAQYLRSPSINVKLEAQTLGRVVVDGAVTSPKVFEVDDIVTLSEAIAQAGGLDENATNGSSVFIVRDIGGERKVREVNLRDIRRLGAPDPQIIPGDVIFVQDSAGRVAFREFLRTVPLLNTAVIYATRR